MAYAPTLTPFTDEAPCPRVQVDFDSFPASTATVTVTRTAAGVTEDVRGAVRRATAGALSVIDFECPFNTEVSYRAQAFDAGGLPIEWTDAGTLGEVAIDDEFEDEFSDLFPGGVGVGLVVLETWVHNPLNPQGAVKVKLRSDTGRSMSRPVPSTLSRPLGRRRAVVLSEPRRGLSGFAFNVSGRDIDTADKVQALLGDDDDVLTPVVCIRIGGRDEPMRVPRPLFLGVPDIVELDTGAHVGYTVQAMSGDEAEPPVPGLYIPPLTAADINAYYATGTALNGDNATGAAVNRRYDLAGYATA